ncbi:MAG: S-adenosyl-l-methionine hydroxide adenosyltransferase family protein [Desulfurococcaceae archaeon]
MRRIIALITDYGYKDPYVGVMKAVIKSINPEAEIIDVTHGIERHNILEAALTLTVSAKYFPPSTIFVVVVDPGVGSGRRAVLIETSNYVLVGPDNGCLTVLSERDGVKRVFDISNSKYRLSQVSHTFHGRDIFAPIAAWVSKGIPLEDIGVEVEYDELVKIGVDKPQIDVERRVIEGAVIYIDVFGNVMTNITEEDLGAFKPSHGSKLVLVINNKSYSCTYEASFSRVPVGELACYINSWGYFEVAVNMGNAAKLLNVTPNKPVAVRF